MHGEQPDADELAALTQRPVLRKAPAADPVLGLVGPAAPPATRPGPLAEDEVRRLRGQVARAHRAGGAEEPEPEPAAVQLRKQGGYYAHEADVRRAQAAWKHTELLPGGYPSWSAFQLAAIMRLTEQLERKHNGGQPFPLLPPGRRVR